MSRIDRIVPESVVGTIAINQTTSGTVDLIGQQLVAVVFPSAFSGTAITFQASMTADGTFTSITAESGGSDYSVTVAASKWTPVNVSLFAGVPFLRIISNASEAAARSVAFIVRQVN